MKNKQIGNILMWGLGTVLTLAASVVQSKHQDAQMKDEVAKQVADAMKNQAKGS